MHVGRKTSVHISIFTDKQTNSDVIGSVMYLNYISCVLVFFSWTAVHSEENLLKTCRHATTYGYGFQFYHRIIDGIKHDEDGYTLEFYVKTKSDAHVLLTSTATPTDHDPMYEIVIGGGKNTFSEIRRFRLRPKETKQTIGVVSESELRGFWIRVSKNGRLEVGAKGSEDPFLFWKDDDPIKVQYFAFCTWTGVLGQWYYSCPDQKDNPEILEVEKNVTGYDKLLEDVLSFVDQYSLPVLDEKTVPTVNFEIGYSRIDFDEKRMIFKFDGYLSLAWHDEKVNWRPDDYNNVTEFMISPFQVWTPELYLLNDVDMFNSLVQGYNDIKVNHNGDMKWTFQISKEAFCTDIELKHWPHDVHTCLLLFAPWFTAGEVSLQVHNNGTLLNPPEEFSSEWKVISEQTFSGVAGSEYGLLSEIKSNQSKEELIEVIVTQFTIKRHSDQYLSVFVPPIVGTAVLLLCSFLLSPRNSAKLYLNCLNIIVQTAFLVKLSEVLPAVTTSVPNIALIYSYGMVATTFAIILTVCVKNACFWIVPDCLIHLLNIHIVRILFCLPQPISEENMTYGKLGDISRETASCNVLQLDYGSLLAQLLERLAFITFIVFYVSLCFM